MNFEFVRGAPVKNKTTEQQAIVWVIDTTSQSFRPMNDENWYPMSEWEVVDAHEGDP